MGCGPSKPTPPPRGQYISYPKRPNHHLAPLPPKPTRTTAARLNGPFQQTYPTRRSQMFPAQKPAARPKLKVSTANPAGRLNGPFQPDHPIPLSMNAAAARKQPAARPKLTVMTGGKAGTGRLNGPFQPDFPVRRSEYFK
ncbi:hypothetical protein ACLMJK_007328 [Lecanora helva]